jgi:LPXTG-motif cell wall-anchored protein
MDTETTVRVVAGVLSVLLVGVIIMRRKNKKSGTSVEDDF